MMKNKRRIKSVTRQMALVASIAVLIGCGPAPSMPSGASGPGNNIALSVLPGEWQVINEPVIFQFDACGKPVAISNPADPNDWRTNVQFGSAGTITTPYGTVDITFTPGDPWVDDVNGVASFAAVGTASNINLIVPLPGEGHATFLFEGHYDATTGLLDGVISYEVYYGTLLITSEANKPYTLEKISNNAAGGCAG